MKKYLQKKLKEQKGMTLIELLAVIVIIAIIAAIAIPAIGNIIENSRLSAVKSDATNVLSAANIYYSENSDKKTVDLDKLRADGYLDSFGELAGTDDVAKTSTGMLELTTAAVKFSGDKTVTFTNASREEITNDKKKGSQVTTAEPLVIGVARP